MKKNGCIGSMWRVVPAEVQFNDNYGIHVFLPTPGDTPSNRREAIRRVLGEITEEERPLVSEWLGNTYSTKTQPEVYRNNPKVSSELLESLLGSLGMRG